MVILLGKDVRKTIFRARLQSVTDLTEKALSI